MVVERYPDRFIFENPGIMLISVEQFRRGGVSECRNKAVQKMFLMIGGGEQAGSGVDKIRTGWQSRHWRAPHLNRQLQPDRLKVTLPMVSLIPEATLAHLREMFDARLDALTPPEVQALATADIEGVVSNTRLQELLTDHPVDIGRMLLHLCERKLLVSDNRRRWTRYRLFGTAVTDSSHSAENSLDLAVDSSHSGAATGLPTESEESLRVIAAPIAAKGRAPVAEVRAVIVQLCRGRFLAAEALAGLLKRSAISLRNQHLTPMVREGALKLRYPDSPNRPDQAYTAEA